MSAVRRPLVRAARRLVRVLVIPLLLAASSPAADAQPVVCVTLSYRMLNGTEHFVFEDDCFVSSGWSPQAGLGPDCNLPPQVVRLCYDVTVSAPGA